MSLVYHISDLHMGHKNILNFAGADREGTCVNTHDKWIIRQWNSVVRKRDTVFVHGDVAMTKAGLFACRQLNGNKKLLMGNHDNYSIDEYLYTGGFSEILPGLERYKGTWLSHCPIHPDELRGKINIHGHVHQNSIMLGRKLDSRYRNVCVEMSYGVPQLFSALK